MNDFQNAYETAKMQKWDQVQKTMDEVRAQHEAGKHVVIIEALAFCPFTDAAMGTKPYMAGAYDTREEAQAFINNYYEEYLSTDEVDMYVYPSYKTNKPITKPDDFEDIPF